ncbi:hypothetical protein ACIOWI_29535 [Streptomyces sp. NPDC087659]|uniref:hypothetical protein n=1 Tax=Streptomyces sp. NPDC087659 TaxID=3365801 RepID=UPI0037FD38E5
MPTPELTRLQAENRQLRETVAALDTQLVQLQTANERMYADDYDATGGPCFDPKQPFPTPPPPNPGQTPTTRWFTAGQA